MENPFTNALTQLDDVQDFLKLPEDLIAQLSEPERVIEVSIPVGMDDGTTRVFKGYRSQFNSALGPYKGGIRYHQDVSLDEVRALSMWMTWKTSVMQLPLGGGKGGIIVDPKQLSESELEKLSRGYIKMLYKYLGPKTDIPAPDVNTNSQIMLWMKDEYSKLVGEDSPGAITGKPVEQGGSKGRDVATAQGGYYVLENLIGNLSLKKEGLKIAIQGFGNAGSSFAKLAAEAGMKVVAVSDSKGAIFSEKGLDIAAIKEHKKKTKSVKDFEGTKNISNQEILELEVDVLVPAALENQIDNSNAKNVKSKIILELANGPVTPEADEVLNSKDIIVIPDILANAGGVTVSYFEQVQNASGDYWSRKDVLEKLEKKMGEAFLAVWQAMQGNKISMRQAAYVVAVKRVAEALRNKGS